MLQYLDSLDNLVLLPQGNAGLLKTFKAFVMHHANTGNPISDSNWITITPDEFDAFHISSEYMLQRCMPLPSTAPLARSQTWKPHTSSRSTRLVCEFKRVVKEPSASVQSSNTVHEFKHGVNQKKESSDEEMVVFEEDTPLFIDYGNLALDAVTLPPHAAPINGEGDANTNCHGNHVDLTSMTMPTANQKDISVSIDNWHAPAQLPVAIQHPCKPPDPPSINTPIGTASSTCIESVANNHVYPSMLAVNVPVLIGLTLAIDPHLCMHWWEMVHFIDPDNPLFTVHRNQNLHYNCTGRKNGETSEISLPHPKDPSTWICQNGETYKCRSAYVSDIAFVIKYIQTSWSRKILL